MCDVEPLKFAVFKGIKRDVEPLKFAVFRARRHVARCETAESLLFPGKRDAL